jgi:hypothetical protein
MNDSPSQKVMLKLTATAGDGHIADIDLDPFDMPVQMHTEGVAIRLEVDSNDFLRGVAASLMKAYVEIVATIADDAEEMAR